MDWRTCYIVDKGENLIKTTRISPSNANLPYWLVEYKPIISAWEHDDYLCVRLAGVTRKYTYTQIYAANTDLQFSNLMAGLSLEQAHALFTAGIVSKLKGVN